MIPNLSTSLPPRPGGLVPGPPTDLPDLDRAAERLRQAIRRREPIAIWGDFDADGLTATALLSATWRGAGRSERLRA